MSEYVYTDIKYDKGKSYWESLDNNDKLACLEELIGYKILNGNNLTYDWDGCPVSDFGGALDSSGDPHIVVQPTFQYIKFKSSGSSQVSKKVYPEQVNGKTIVKLSGTLHWGEISFAIDTKNLYQWKNGVDELNTGFGFLLDNNIETKKFPSVSDDIYLINTQNFKIQDKKICVYGRAGASEVDSGNYTYKDNFNYGYATGRNYYAWGKNEVQVIPLWTNESSDDIGEVDESNGIVVNDQHVLIYLKGNEKPIAYDRPRNSKVVICKRVRATDVTWKGTYLSHSSIFVNRPHYTCTVTSHNNTETSISLSTEGTQIPSSTLSFYQSTQYLLSTDGKTYTSYQSPSKWNVNLGFEAVHCEQSDYITEYNLKKNLWTYTNYDLARLQIEKDTTKYTFKITGLYRSSLFKLDKPHFTMRTSDPVLIAEKGLSYIGIHAITEIDVPGISNELLYEESWLSGENEKGTLEHNGTKYPYYYTHKLDIGQAAIYASTRIETTKPYPCYWVFIVPQDFDATP